ncbi:hypothetical protein [Leclercia sp. AS011]|uniref:hypothetical protein n=1 Tax=Leclercia sp. AS011 TaxID=3081257 RepID=UPI003017FFD4
MSDSMSNKELVVFGHHFAKAMSSDTPINKLWTGNAVYKAMLASSPQQKIAF